MSQFAMIDGIEGIVFRIGLWSKASEKTDNIPGQEYPSTLGTATADFTSTR